MNFGSILVLLGVIALVAWLIYGLATKKIGGCSDCDGSCGGACSGCQHGAACQANAQTAVPKGDIMIQTIVQIDGMACSMCEAHVSDAIRKAFDVKSVKASHKKKTAEILSDTPLDEAALHAAIDPTGYTVGAVTSHPYEKKGLFGRK